MSVGNKIHVGDIGTTLAFYIGVDCSQYSKFTVKYEHSGEVVGEWTATVSGTDVKTIIYVTKEGDISASGPWKFQAHVANSDDSLSLSGEMIEETIYPII
jgi:hypothetical protein